MSVRATLSEKMELREKLRTHSTRAGLLYGLAAYGFWGLAVPVYFKAVGWASPVELLGQRILWTTLLLAGLVVLTGRGQTLRHALCQPRTLGLMCLSAVLLGINWLVYLYSVATDQMVQAGLGYFMLPMVSVLFGLVFLGERLRPWQWVAVGLAAIGVLNLALRSANWPWIALALAGSFGLYGWLRKVTPVAGLVGLSAEVFLLSPFAAGLLIYLGHMRGLAWTQVNWRADLLLACSGVVTATPLLWFGKAARLLPLSTLGFIQYLSPCLQCAVAVWIYREPFKAVQLESFALIWLALTVVSFDSIRARQRAAALVATGDPDILTPP